MWPWLLDDSPIYNNPAWDLPGHRTHTGKRKEGNRRSRKRGSDFLLMACDNLRQPFCFLPERELISFFFLSEGATLESKGHATNPSITSAFGRLRSGKNDLSFPPQIFPTKEHSYTFFP